MEKGYISVMPVAKVRKIKASSHMLMYRSFKFGGRTAFLGNKKAT